MAGIPLGGSNFTRGAGIPLDDTYVQVDLTARDAIVSGVRYEGMPVFVLSEAKEYRLKGGITNGDWYEDGGGGGGGTGLEIKSGVVPDSSFAGTPLKFSVVFTTPFAADYSVAFGGVDSRSFTYETKTLAGFTINTNANTALTDEVSWIAVEEGEGAGGGGGGGGGGPFLKLDGTTPMTGNIDMGTNQITNTSGMIASDGSYILINQSGGDAATNVTGDSDELVAGDKETQVTGDYTLAANTLALSSNTGTVSISGRTDVIIETTVAGGGDITMTADGDLNLSGVAVKINSVEVDVAGGSTGDVLTFNGTKYVPQAPSGGGAVTSVNGQTGVVVVTATDVGLGNADNTSDINKPVSTAQATAIGLKVDKAGDTMTGQLIAPSFQVSDSSETLTSSYDSGNNTMLIESSDDLTLKANDTLYVDALVTRTDGEIYHKGSHVLSPDGMSSFNTTFDFGGDFFKLDANKLVVYNAKDFQINGELGIVMQNSLGSSLVLSDLMQIAVNGGGGYSFTESASGSFLSTKESEPFKIQTPYNDGFFMQAFDGVEFIFGSLINKPFSVYNENTDVKDNQLFLNANGESSLSSYNNNDVKLNAPTGVAINLPSSAATANLDILESDSSKASLRIRAGSAPSSPNNGDIWFDGTNLNIHIGGVTKTFLLV